MAPRDVLLTNTNNLTENFLFTKTSGHFKLFSLVGLQIRYKHDVFLVSIISVEDLPERGGRRLTAQNVRKKK